MKTVLAQQLSEMLPQLMVIIQDYCIDDKTKPIFHTHFLLLVFYYCFEKLLEMSP
jgi:hypothetical protein